MAKKCVNGNCSRRKNCGTYHQALNTFEATGANGKFERYTCRKGKCEEFIDKSFLPYGEEWIRETSKLPKKVIIGMLAGLGEEYLAIKSKYESL